MADPELITRLLAASNGGDEEAHAELVELLYRQLQTLARQQRRKTGGPPTLSTTALVNDAYLRLFDGAPKNFKDRSHFFGCAALAMRQLLIDHARRRSADKRAPEVPMPTLPPEVAAEDTLDPDELLELDQALERLRAVDERLCRLVELRFFAGLNVEQIAELLEVSPRTVVRDWRKARAFLNVAAA